MAFPILPNMENQLEAFASQLVADKCDAYNTAQASVQKENWWIQRTPMGSFCIVHFEAVDPLQVFSSLRESSDPFDSWFKQEVLKCTGVDLSTAVVELPQQILAWRKQ